MKGAAISILGILACLAPQVVSPKAPARPQPVLTWSMYFPDVPVQPRPAYPVGVLTPVNAIVIRRIEALSNRGPFQAGTNAVEPGACPGQFTLEVTDGAVTQTVPISNVFVGKRTTQTYTDSGPVNWSFSANTRMTVLINYPPEQFPPVNCTLTGMNITVQYEMANHIPDEAASSEDQ